MSLSKEVIKVWDPIVRIGHWMLVIAFFTAYFTEEEFLNQHVIAGYIVGGVVLFRILWGFIGTRHARFKDFIYKPSAVIGYLKGLLQKKPQHYLGHNPAGGAMVIALLFALSATTFTGLKLYAIEKNAGPFANDMYSQSLTPTTTPAVIDNEANETNEGNVNKEDETYWEGLHEFFVNLTLLLVVLHIAGVIISSRIDKENLVKAMITGRKEISNNNIIE